MQQLILGPMTLYKSFCGHSTDYDSIATVGEIRVWWRADFQSVEQWRSTLMRVREEGDAVTASWSWGLRPWTIVFLYLALNIFILGFALLDVIGFKCKLYGLNPNQYFACFPFLFFPLQPPIHPIFWQYPWKQTTGEQNPRSKDTPDARPINRDPELFSLHGNRCLVRDHGVRTLWHT